MVAPRHFCITHGGEVAWDFAAILHYLHEEPLFVVVFNLDPILLCRRDPFRSTPNTLEVTNGFLCLNYIHRAHGSNPTLFNA